MQRLSGADRVIGARARLIEPIEGIDAAAGGEPDGETSAIAR
jgi:hypothetical protein